MDCTLAGGFYLAAGKALFTLLALACFVLVVGIVFILVTYYEKRGRRK